MRMSKKPPTNIATRQNALVHLSDGKFDLSQNQWKGLIALLASQFNDRQPQNDVMRTLTEIDRELLNVPDTIRPIPASLLKRIDRISQVVSGTKSKT